MTQVMELLKKIEKPHFKKRKKKRKTMLRILRTLMEKEKKNKPKRKILQIKNTVTNMKKTFDEFINRLTTTK